MALSWNEIKKRAIEFSKEWENETREHAEAKTFWDGFFNVFGISRKRLASFEEPVKKLGDKQGFIDLFWKGTLIAESKSRGRDLDKAYSQALDYFPGLKEVELPKYVVVTDFARIRLYDLIEDTFKEFPTDKLHENVKLFAFIAGYSKTDFKTENPVNIKAAELMGKLHDSLSETGYSGHVLEVFLVRVLFCLFADDTGIFEKGIFSDYIMNKTKEDGTDVGPQIAQLFQVLDTPEDKRFATLDEDLARFPYVNGKLFEESLHMSSFDSKMREALLTCCSFDWGKISPAVFGSLFQSVMDQEKRRNLGAHYTSEENILKLIRPLFLDELWEEFEKVKSNKSKLAEFHKKLAELAFLDPACGCGNFLVVTYRELRLLELEVLKTTYKSSTLFEISYLVKVDVDQFYGIEIEEFPARIAEVALWLVDHQMNVKVSEELGHYFIRLPLKKSAKIVNGNALLIDWKEIILPEKLGYILGNPPFIGKHLRTVEQLSDLNTVAQGIKNAGVLDYVSCWYIKAAQYIQDTKIQVAYVSTKSISQGEQVGVLWNELFSKYKIKIHFAHRTFQWNSEAKGKAAVHVVIIGFGAFDVETKYLFEYENVKGEPHAIKVQGINPYLVDGDDVVIVARSRPICTVPPMVWGSKPVDNGLLIFSDFELKEFLDKEPGAKKYIHRLISAKEYMSGINRWVLWLNNADPEDLKSCPEVLKRVEGVRDFRMLSNKLPTKEAASRPGLFAEIRQPSTDYITIPLHTSETRTYIPISKFSPDVIINNSMSYVPNATKFHFGVLSSKMHMTWTRYVSGRIKSDYRYSGALVYNTYPWPINAAQFHMNEVEEAADKVLKIREAHTGSSLSALYGPLTIPRDLLEAHKELDLLVDKCYRNKPFMNEQERIKFLFDLYFQYTQAGGSKKK